MKNIICYFLISFLSILTCQQTQAQGKLLLVGGGSEQDILPSGDNPGGWSTPPYSWFVNQASNKKIAIIRASGTATTFLGNYFTTQCGAVYAEDILINSFANANTQAIYDKLITFDGVFFRGGDQSQYYNFYRNTSVSSAINSIYNRGGVIGGTSAGMHILSSVVYPALGSSAVPFTALQNVRSSDVELRNDLFNFFPGFVFDSHAIERGRMPRTIAFMGRGFLDYGTIVNAIAVDDLTAMAIDENKVGTAYGTGSVGIYRSTATQASPFRTPVGNKLVADSITITHVINGWSYDFNSNTLIKPTVTGGYAVSTPASNTLDVPVTVLLGGNTVVGNNTSMLGHFLNEVGSPSDKIYIITQDSAVANGAMVIKQTLTALGASLNQIFIVLNNSLQSNDRFVSELSSANKILFVNNTLSQITSFINNSTAGIALKARFTAPGVAFCFFGQNSRLAGKTALADNFISANSYGGLLTASNGLNILPNTLVVPQGMSQNTAGASPQMENTVSASTYFALRDHCAFSILVPGFTNSSTFVKYYIDSVTGNTFINSYGSVSAFLFRNTGNEYAFSNTTSRGDGTQTPRQVAGFSNMLLSLVDNTNPVKVGNVEQSTIVPPSTLASNIVINNQVASSITLDESLSLVISFTDESGIQRNLTENTVFSVSVNSGTTSLVGNTTFTGFIGNGVVTLNGLSFSGTATGVVLQISSPSFSSALTSVFNILPIPPSTIASNIIVENQVASSISLGEPLTLVISFTDENGIQRNLTSNTTFTVEVLSGNVSIVGSNTFEALSGSSALTLSGLQFSNTASGIVLQISAIGFDDIQIGPFSITENENNNTEYADRFSLTLLNADTEINIRNETFGFVVNFLGADNVLLPLENNSTLNIRVKSGNGSLVGTTTFAIAAGTTTYTVSGLSYSLVENDVIFAVSISGLNEIELEPLSFRTNSSSSSFDNYFEVYPNPSSGIINILTKDKSKYQLFDLQHRILKSGLSDKISTQLDISDLHSGVYFLYMSNDTLNHIIRIIKN